jgi:ammonium transporter, Amt family
VVTTMMMSFATLASVSITWSIIGYSLTFGPGDGPSAPFIGGTHFGFFDSRDRVRDGTAVPEHAFMMFQVRSGEGAASSRIPGCQAGRPDTHPGRTPLPPPPPTPVSPSRQLMFAIITAAVVSGSVAGRMRLWSWLVFSTVWNFLVYIPLARWVFYSGGWLAQWGVLDFAGGIPVETASGVSAIVLAYWLDRGRKAEAAAAGADGDPADGAGDLLLLSGRRPSAAGDDGHDGHGGDGHGHGHGPKPHNVPYILLGAGLLFFGWFGFNAGSALASGYLSSRAFANTHLAAAAAMAGWAGAEIVWGGDRLFRGVPTAVGCATGVVVGLVAITPACGYVSQMFAILIGFTCSPLSYWAHRGILALGVDDTLGCFPGHGVAGMYGILMTGLFASTDEGSPADGAAYGNPALLGKQAAAIAIALVVCVVGTSLSYGVVAGIAAVFRMPVAIASASHVDVELTGERAYVYSASSPPGGKRGPRLSRSHSLIAALLPHVQSHLATHGGAFGGAGGGIGSPGGLHHHAPPVGTVQAR